MPYKDRADSYAAKHRYRKRQAAKRREARASKTLQRLLKDADIRVKQAAMQALNNAGEELVEGIKESLNSTLNTISGNLEGSVTYEPATENKLMIRVKATATKPAPKKPGSRTPAMKQRYDNGAPYGAIIEFSPRINKPWFYPVWYRKRDKIKQDVLNAVGDAWSAKS